MLSFYVLGLWSDDKYTGLKSKKCFVPCPSVPVNCFQRAWLYRCYRTSGGHGVHVLPFSYWVSHVMLGGELSLLTCQLPITVLILSTYQLMFLYKASSRSFWRMKLKILLWCKNILKSMHIGIWRLFMENEYREKPIYGFQS